MTKHEFLTWAVPFFTLITIIGATLSIVRLLSKGSKHLHSNFDDPYHPYSGTSIFLAFQPSEKGAAFVYVMAALGLVLATGILLTLALEF
jgi:hypothetical protein